MVDSRGNVNSRYIPPTVLYVSPTELAKQMAYRNVDDPRLNQVAIAATELIDDWVGNQTQFDPIPETIHNIALSLAIDIWKQPDATFGIMGMGETGTVRAPRDLLQRYDAQLIPFYDPQHGWGIG
jgi:hypothetical protein